MNDYISDRKGRTFLDHLTVKLLAKSLTAIVAASHADSEILGMLSVDFYVKVEGGHCGRSI